MSRRTTDPGDYRDPRSRGNSEEFRTGATCVEHGCPQPAGTFWSRLWCVEHNIARMDRINRGFDELLGRKRE